MLKGWIMRKLMPTVLAVLVFLIAQNLQADPEKSHLITMILPDTVIAEALKRVLQLAFDSSSSGIEGTITIVGIANFRMKDGQILCRLDLMGNKLHFVTSVANQDIRLNLGSARVDFDCDARIRFDAARKTLFIRPTAGDVQSSSDLGKIDIGQAIMLLVNGREFPVNLQDLKPIIAETSDKIITIRTNIVDIKAVEGALRVSIEPLVGTARRQVGAGKRSGN
jgi:hypothetical protein